MVSRANKKFVLFAACIIGLVYLAFYGGFERLDRCDNVPTISLKPSVVNKDGALYEYDRQSPIVFIGGIPRSGTTLMRAMLDAHPEVRCGEETRVVPRILQMGARWMKSTKESMRLEEAGLNGAVLDSAISSFILDIIAKHGEPATRLCNKDPFTLQSGMYLKQLFPNGKFLFMVRDGRATVHSIITRNVTITGFDLKSYRQCLTKWNAAITKMNDQCTELGTEHCLKVPYEQLVLHPRKWMQKILEFLELSWTEDVLHHEKQINKPSGISLSNVEQSSDQVVKPVNLDAISKWVGHIPEDVVADMAEIAPMLKAMGYDPHGNPPKYGDADTEVIENRKNIKQQHNDDWEKQGELVKQK